MANVQGACGVGGDKFQVDGEAREGIIVAVALTRTDNRVRDVTQRTRIKGDVEKPGPGDIHRRDTVNAQNKISQ